MAELGLAVGLWVFVAGVVAESDFLLGAGVLVMTAALAVPARTFLRVAHSGKIGAREGPVAHVAVGPCSSTRRQPSLSPLRPGQLPIDVPP